MPCTWDDKAGRARHGGAQATVDDETSQTHHFSWLCWRGRRFESNQKRSGVFWTDFVVREMMPYPIVISTNNCPRRSLPPPFPPPPAAAACPFFGFHMQMVGATKLVTSCVVVLKLVGKSCGLQVCFLYSYGIHMLQRPERLNALHMG